MKYRLVKATILVIILIIILMLDNAEGHSGQHHLHPGDTYLICWDGDIPEYISTNGGEIARCATQDVSFDEYLPVMIDD